MPQQSGEKAHSYFAAGNGKQVQAYSVSTTVYYKYAI